MKVVTRFKKCAFASLLTLVTLPAAAFDPPTMGWSTWNTYDLKISESRILKQAYTLAHSKLKDCGYKYINIDAGYLAGRADNGDLILLTDSFPHPLRHLTDSVHALGLKPGIYSDAGSNFCIYYYRPAAIAQTGKNTGLYNYEQRDMDYFLKESNFDFIKVDYCGGQNQHLNEEETFRRIKQAIDNTGRTDVQLNVCRWEYPGTWVNDVATSWRVTQDITANWSRVKAILAEGYYLSAYASKGHYNDLDMLEVGNGMSEIEDRTHFGMWCMMSSPLLIGCDLTKASQKTLDLLSNKDLIAVNQDTLGLQAEIVRKDGETLFFCKDLETLNGTKRAVAVYNPSNSAVTVTLDFTKDCLLKGNIKTRDLYTGIEKSLETATTQSITLPAHGTQIYSVTGDERVEQTFYEGETAWLKKYQELNGNLPTARYATNANASGEKVVGTLGNNADNYMEWRNVYTKTGGQYKLSIKYASTETRNFTVTVNGTDSTAVTVGSSNGNIGSKTIVVTLKPGINVVKIGNASGFAPDIDGMTVRPAASSISYVGTISMVNNTDQTAIGTTTTTSVESDEPYLFLTSVINGTDAYTVDHVTVNGLTVSGTSILPTGNFTVVYYLTKQIKKAIASIGTPYSNATASTAINIPDGQTAFITGGRTDNVTTDKYLGFDGTNVTLNTTYVPAVGQTDLSYVWTFKKVTNGYTISPCNKPSVGITTTASGTTVATGATPGVVDVGAYDAKTCYIAQDGSTKLGMQITTNGTEHIWYNRDAGIVGGPNFKLLITPVTLSAATPSFTGTITLINNADFSTMGNPTTIQVEEGKNYKFLTSYNDGTNTYRIDNIILDGSATTATEVTPTADFSVTYYLTKVAGTGIKKIGTNAKTTFYDVQGRSKTSGHGVFIAKGKKLVK